MQFNIAESFDPEDEVSLQCCSSDTAPIVISLKGAAVKLNTSVSPLRLSCQLTPLSKKIQRFMNINLCYSVLLTEARAAKLLLVIDD